MEKFIPFLVVLASFGLHTRAETFSFSSADYSIEETRGADNEDATTVMITRSGTATELALESTTTISTECPKSFTATATSPEDYSLGSTTVSFAANSASQSVTVTIKTDETEEFREYFCLTITSDAGTQYYTKIYIPGNDYCVSLGSPAESTADADGITDPTKVIYVGPWCVGDGAPDTIYIDIEPEPSPGTGNDIFIWLTDVADQADTNIEFYGIFLDDTIAAATHDGSPADAAADGDSVVVKTDVVGANTALLLNDVDDGINDVVTFGENRFSLQYTESGGEIELTDVVSDDVYTVDDDTGTPIDVSHILVSSGDASFASWRVCDLSPRKIPAVGVSASGHVSTSGTFYPPSRAIDGKKEPIIADSFISDSRTDPWIQIDLGREYDVKMVLIWPGEDLTGTSDPAWLDNADIYVGSCPPTSTASITSNNVCDNNIGTVDGKAIIEVRCATNTYGRYVYILQDTSSQVQIALSEVEVYGDDVPVDDEPTVQFSQATFSTSNDESALGVTITATRTGAGLTCTTADFYTDTVTVPGGNTDDFTPVLSNNPTVLEWTADDGTGTTKTTTVVVANDDVCESTETFNVHLANVIGGVLGYQSTASASIIDDDSVTYALTSSTYDVPEGDSESIGVSRSGTGNMQAGSVGLTFSDGTAKSGDYSNAAATVEFTATSTSPQTYTVSAIEDQAYEEDETFTVNLGHLEPSTCSNAGSPSSATVTIKDNDSLFSWDTSDETIRIPEGTSSYTVNIKREGVQQSKTVEIDVDLIDAESSDFSVSGDSVTFSINDGSESITINVVDDSVVESDESFTLTLEDPLYTTGNKNQGDPYKLTVIIEDDDAEYSWKQSQQTVSESVGTIQVCLLRTGDISSSKTVQISSSVTNSADFTQLTQITFSSGNSEKCENIAIFDDNNVENDETFTLTIDSGQQDVQTGATDTTTVTITDDDNDVSWQSSVYSFNEGIASNNVRIVKSGSRTITVTLTTQQESATQGVDFAPVSTSVVVSGNGANVPITIIDDEDDEPSETFSLRLSGDGITSSTTRITIIDNDEPTPTTTPPPEEDGLGSGAIAAIVIAGVIGLLVLIGAIMAGLWWFCRAPPAPSPAAAPSSLGSYPLVNYPNYSNYPQITGNDGYGNGLNNGFGNGSGFNNGFYTNQGLRGFFP